MTFLCTWWCASYYVHVCVRVRFLKAVIMACRVYAFVLLVGMLCISTCRGLYFHIGETEQKCFIEEVPSETMIVGELGQ